MYGFIITTAGEGLLARASAGEGLTLTEVWVGKGAVESAGAAKALTALLDPVAKATSTTPAVAGGQISMLVEYRNDMGGGLEEGFTLSEFGVMAKVGEDAPTLLYYAALGDRAQPVPPIAEGLDVHRFPVAIGVTGEVEVSLEYPAGVWVTHEELEEALAGIDLSGYIKATEKGKPGGVATLGEDGKVPAGQLPAMNYDPAGSAEAVQKALTAHTGNKDNPHAVTAEQVGALASSGGVMSGAISMSGHKIANLAAPTDLTDAAHKSYVDEHVDQTLKQKLGYKLIKEYTSPGSYTHTFDRKYTDVFVVVVGAGGGGGSSGERGGGGGGGGAVACFHVLDSSTIQNNNIVVGTGGAGADSSWGPSVTNNGSAGGSSSAFGITVPGGSGGIANLGGMGGGYAPNEIVPGWLMIGGSGGSHNNNGDGDGNAGPIISIVGFKPFGGGGGGGGNPSLNDPPTPGGNGGDGGAGNGGAGATGQSNAIMGKNGTRGGGGGGGGAGWTFRSSEYKPSGIGGKGGDGYVAIYGRE